MKNRNVNNKMVFEDENKLFSVWGGNRKKKNNKKK